MHHAINEYQLRLDVQRFLWPAYYINYLYYVGTLSCILGCNYGQGANHRGCSKFPQVTNSVVLNVYLPFDWASLCLLSSASWACSCSWFSSISLNLREHFLSLLRSMLYKHFFNDHFARNHLADVNSSRPRLDRFWTPVGSAICLTSPYPKYLWTPHIPRLYHIQSICRHTSSLRIPRLYCIQGIHHNKMADNLDIK